MSSVKWLRFLPSAFAAPSRSDGGLSVLIPFKLDHAREHGVNSQSELSGPGSVDVKFEVGPTETDWTWREAHSYCVGELKNALNTIGGNDAETFRRFLHSTLEHQRGTFTDRQITAPSGQLSQEVVVPEGVLTEFIEYSESSIDYFLLLKEIGLQCLDCGNLDRQPQEFRTWFGEFLNGKRRPPSKRPEYWKKYTRDSFVASLVGNLSRRGINPTRNDATPEQTCGCDIVASAAKEAKVPGISSYETVKKIYFKQWRQ